MVNDPTYGTIRVIGEKPVSGSEGAETESRQPPARWKVRFEDIQAKMSRYPFWRQSTVVTAVSRRDAIEQVMAMFGPPKYGHFRASKASASDRK